MTRRAPSDSSGSFQPPERRRPWVGVVTLVLLACVGCTPEPEPILRVGTNVWPGYEPLYLARDLGYLDGSIRLVEYSSATQVISAYRNGAIEAAALTLDEALLLTQHGPAPRVILVMDISHGGDVILGAPRLRRLADLKGRRVGVEHSATGAYVLSRALRLAGLTRADVRLIPLEVDEHERAFRDGRVDAVVTFEPVRSKLLAAGARQLFDSSQIPGEIMDVLVVRPDRLDRHRRQIVALLAGWFRALDDLRRAPRDVAPRIAKRLRLSVDQVLASYDGLRLPDAARNRALLTGDPPELALAARRLADVMVAEKLLPKPLDVAPVFDPGPLLGLAP